MTNAVASSSQPTDPPPVVQQPTPGATAYHESSQYRRWRFSAEQLEQMRRQVNGKAREVISVNIDKEKELRIADGTWVEPKSPPNYPSPEDELELVRYYVNQVSAMCSQAFDPPLPELVEGTAMSYMKRFFTQCSCMDYHPKSIIPVALFLAGKTNNLVLPLDDFITRFAKLKKEDIVDLEFTVIQKLKFDVYVQRVGSALHGWFLKLQELPNGDVNRIAKAYHVAKSHVSRSRRSDAEFIYTPSQITLACMRKADRELVSQMLDLLYGTSSNGDVVKAENGMEVDGEDIQPSMEGLTISTSLSLARRNLEAILDTIDAAIDAVNDDYDLKKVKEVDKMLKSCRNPMRDTESAIYKKLLLNHQVKAAERRAIKLEEARKEMSKRDTIFGPVVGATHLHGGAPHMGESGMGIPAESGGLVFGGEGLRDVGLDLEDDSSDSD